MPNHIEDVPYIAKTEVKNLDRNVSNNFTNSGCIFTHEYHIFQFSFFIKYYSGLKL